MTRMGPLLDLGTVSPLRPDPTVSNLSYFHKLPLVHRHPSPGLASLLLMNSASRVATAAPLPQPAFSEALGHSQHTLLSRPSLNSHHAKPGHPHCFLVRVYESHPTGCLGTLRAHSLSWGPRARQVNQATVSRETREAGRHGCSSPAPVPSSSQGMAVGTS